MRDYTDGIAAGGGEHGDDDALTHAAPSHHNTPSGYAAQYPTPSSTHSWAEGYDDDGDDDDDDDHDDYDPPSHEYSKPSVVAYEPATLYETRTVPTTIHYANTVVTTVSVQGPAGPTVYVTSLTSEPTVTVYITTTLVETDVYPTTVTCMSYSAIVHL